VCILQDWYIKAPGPAVNIYARLYPPRLE
jgi:hypothetical protein